MASDVGSILLIVGASLIGIGAIALSATTYSIDDMLTKSNNRATYKKETVKSDTEDEDEEEDIMDVVTDLSKKLPNSVSGFNRDQYSLTPEEGWSVSKGGKKRSRKRKTNKSKSKSRKSKFKK
jgi:hypothetical protein